MSCAISSVVLVQNPPISVPDLCEDEFLHDYSEYLVAPWVGCPGVDYQLERERNALLEKVEPLFTKCTCDTRLLQAESGSIEEALARVDNFADFCKFIKHAHADLSFFGSKYVSIEGCEGTLDIDIIAKRAIDLIDANPNFSIEERAHGIRVSSSISKLYRDSRVLVENSCFITMLIVAVRDLFKLIFLKTYDDNIDWHWEKCSWLYCVRNPCGLDDHLEMHDGYHSTFQFFTSQQLLNDLGISADHPSVEPGHGPHNRCYAIKNSYQFYQR